jgi:uncharacterized protein with GYD domain
MSRHTCKSPSRSDSWGPWAIARYWEKIRKTSARCCTTFNTRIRAKVNGHWPIHDPSLVHEGSHRGFGQEAGGPDPRDPLIEKIGGRLLDFYFAFGDYDGVIIAELPDNTAALATDLAAVVPGHVGKIKTTVLLGPEEAVAAMNRAAGAEFRGPGA